MSIAEIVAELLYAEKPLAEIAGYDDCQLQQVVFRPRDKHGNLIRCGEEPGEGKELLSGSFTAMFREVWKSRGLNKKQIDGKWQEYLDKNPSLVELIERKQHRRR